MPVRGGDWVSCIIAPFLHVVCGMIRAGADSPASNSRPILPDNTTSVPRSMSNDPKAAVEAERRRLGTAAVLARFALVGVALVGVAGTFAYLGGWFTPHELTPARFVDGFESLLARNSIRVFAHVDHAAGGGVQPREAGAHRGFWSAR